MLQCPSNGATVFAMRHRKKLPKLNRPADQRKALLRSLTTETLRHGKITTTKVGPGVGSCGPPELNVVEGREQPGVPAPMSAGPFSSLLSFQRQVKAKAVRKYVDKMIQLAKDGSLHARRQVGISIKWCLVARSLAEVENNCEMLTVVA